MRHAGQYEGGEGVEHVEVAQHDEDGDLGDHGRERPW